MLTVACTIPAYKMTGDDPMSWGAWLVNAEAVQESVNDEVRYFCAIEVDARGLEPFGPLLDRLKEIGGTYWTFSLDDGTDVITTPTRLLRIVTGHNFCGYHAIESGASHTLFLASDTQARDDVLPRLLELDVAAAACHIPTYGLDGPPAWHSKMLKWTEQFGHAPDVRRHMESCACMLLRRDIIAKFKWRYDPDAGTTDDPSMHHDLLKYLGEEVYVRHDVLATHWPESIPPVEYRHTVAERTVHR